MPPSSVLDEVVEVVRSVPAPDGTTAALLDQVEMDRLSIPITNFGNVTTADAHRLAEAIAASASGWTAPIVRFAGGGALEFPGDWSVWAKLGGELELLTTVARGVTASVERHGFFVDRRLFRPMLSVATVTAATTGPYLGAVVDALDAFSGRDWRVGHVVLTTESFVDGRPRVREFERIPLSSENGA